METLVFIVLAVAILSILWVRYAPIDRDAWHVDPAEAEGQGLRLIGRDAPRFPAETETVLETFKEIVMEEPRVRVLDGSIDEGMITFIARSKSLGFPDFVTAKAVGEGRMTKLALAARPRFKFQSSGGTNRERLDRWLAEVELRLGN